MKREDEDYIGHKKNDHVDEILEGRESTTETAGSFIEGDDPIRRRGDDPIRRRGDGREGVEEVMGTQFTSLQVKSVLFMIQPSNTNTVAIHKGGQLKEVGLLLISNDTIQFLHIHSPLCQCCGGFTCEMQMPLIANLIVMFRQNQHVF